MTSLKALFCARRKLTARQGNHLKAGRAAKSISAFEEAIASFESQAAVGRNSLFTEESRNRLGKELSNEHDIKARLNEQKQSC